MNQKKQYLLIWPTYRKDWLHTFELLKADFNFTFIPGTFPQEPNYASEYTCRYWSEFSSVFDVLEQTQPDGIIFMSIESGLSMALNAIAKKEGIKTIILQHGIFTNYKDYRNREKLWRKGSRAKETQVEQTQKGFSTLQFLKKSFSGINLFYIAQVALYTQLQQRIGPYWVSKWLPLSIKKADQYLCYSPYNATIHRETDRISEKQIAYIGSPELMGYLQKEKDLIDASFYLHMDQALAENSFGEETVSKQAMIEFYLKLNSFAKRQNAKLYIKLHPESYASDWLPQDDNIVYLKQIDNFNRYVQSALGCFGFYSTMVIPAVYWKPTILFHIQYSGLQEALKSLVNLPILSFHDFHPDDIDFGFECDRQKIKEYFIQPQGVKKNTLRNLLAAQEAV